ncbi:hypothetical protein [Corynebacterium lubricantis]|uniref:hypothetical protein n=1 Tax=Corynebacterium lubricantis TaxID=541095 RepID=UPI00036A660B|nr:hypothetical protein [Corynebacterium lubricantis]
MKSRSLLSAAVSAVLLTGIAVTPANAFEVTPVSYGGCHLQATHGDAQLQYEYEQIYRNTFVDLAKQRVPAAAADIEVLAAHGRATVAQRGNVAEPDHIYQLIEKVNGLSNAAGYGEWLGLDILTAVRGEYENSYRNLQGVTKQYGQAQARAHANETAQGYHELFHPKRINKSGQTDAWYALEADAFAAAESTNARFNASLHEAFQACANGTALYDDSEDLPREDMWVSPDEVDDINYGFDNASSAIANGDPARALHFVGQGIQGVIAQFQSLLLLPFLPFINAFLSTGSGSSS